VPNFKLKLFLYFLLMGVLPLAAATWAVARVQAETETRATDARLSAELRAALASYRRDLGAASAPAVRLARSPRIAQRLEAAAGHVLYVDRDGAVLARRPSPSAVRKITVVGRSLRIGTVAAVVPIDRQFLERIRRAAGLPADEHVALLRHGRVVVADDPAIRGVPSDSRLLAARALGTPSAALAVLTPRPAGRVTGQTTEQLLAALAVLLVLAGLIAYFEGRAIVRTIRSLVAATDEIACGRLEHRVEVQGHDELATLGRAFNTMAQELATRAEELESERIRVRQVVSGFGAALAATHDVDGLVRVIVETAVEATGASGGTFVGTDTILGYGDFEDDAAERLELPVEGGGTRFGILTLVGGPLDSDTLDTARSLVSQAVVALENERLHRIVARQAMTDSLTGLANRRRGEEALRAELAHVRRFGGSLAVVIADVDDFKRLNDTHGHAAGDAVLRELGDVLRASLRQSDLAARWGGEEFLLLLRETDLEGAHELAERIRSALETRTILTPNGARLTVTASFGVTAYETVDRDVDVVAAADDALYVAKRRGKNRVEQAAPTTIA
jgi:diguanylate cyclase (GGDEF)-like protein